MFTGLIWRGNAKRRDRIMTSRRRHHGERPFSRRLFSEVLEDRRLLTLTTVDLTTGLLAADLAQALVGPGVSISNVKYTGDNTAAGKFSGGTSEGLGVDAGVMLSSGKISNAAGPNNSDGISASFNLPGDTDLDGLISGGATTHDASVLEFDFVATGGSLSFQYVFGSDEYNEFVNSFNDVFGFFLNGTNVALIPGTTTPVSINNVNKDVNSKFYRNNDLSDFGGKAPFPTQADGFTVVLQSAAIVNPGTNHIKLAIADAGDTALDSWVFLTAQSFVSGQADVAITNTDSPDPVPQGDPLTYTLAVTNHGPDKATAVLVQDTLPANVTFVSAVASQGNIFQAGGIVTATPGDLASGASATITITVIPQQIGKITSTATVQAAQVDSIPENNTATANTLVTRFKVSNVSLLEGNSGLTDFVFSISQIAGHKDTAIVPFATANGLATAGSDYIAQQSTLTFAPGDTKKLVTVQGFGDRTYEPDENFFLIFNDTVDSEVDKGVGTIINDDAGVLINDLTVLEGDAGTKDAVFTVSLVGPLQQTAITMNYNSSDGTANAVSDYLARHGVLTFMPGTVTQTITIPIVGDKLNELTEDFFVTLSNSVNADLVKSVAIGTILDNDLRPSLYVSDVQITTTEDGLLAAVFSVALDVPSGLNVTVQYATADGVAKANTDYLSKAGTVSFPQGSIKQLVTVPVLGSAVYGPNEKFYLNLFNPVNALLADSQGVGTIVFAPPPASETIVDDGEEGFTQSLAGWSAATNLTAYHSDYMIHAPNNGTGTATWKFAGILPGQYQVLARWIAFSTFASNAPYTIFDGTANQGTVRVNQQLLPAGDSSNGVVWQSLGTFNNTTGTLKVQLGDNANGYVIADAIRIVADGIGAQVPEMDVSAFDTSIGDGASAPQFADGTDFGTLPATTGATTHTFTITNTGNADLHLSGSPHVAISGAAAQDFTVVTQPADTVAPGRTTTFQIMFHPSAAGVRQAFISIANDDSSESNYSFEIGGTGADAGLNELIVDDSSSNFSLSGNWTSAASASAVQGEFRSDAAGQGNDHATWTFPGLAPGHYQVFTTWVPFGNRATNAPFTVFNGSDSQTVLVNQQQSPGDDSAAGVAWKLLTTVEVTSGTLTVGLNNQSNGFVIADAIRIVRVDPPAAVHNASMPLDVNNDQIVSAMDALVVINKLIAQSANSASSSASSSASPLVATNATTADNSAAQYFLDVNDDTIVSPIDALIVINFLNQPGALASSSSVSLAASPAASTLTATSATVPAAKNENAVDQAISQLDAGSPASSGSTNDLATNPGTVPAGIASVTVVAPSSGAAPLLSQANVRAAFSASGSKKNLGESDSDSLLG